MLAPGYPISRSVGGKYRPVVSAERQKRYDLAAMECRIPALRSVKLLLALPLLALLAQAAPAAAAIEQESVDEVVVKGTRGKQLTEMMKQMVTLEDDFYARYNELNTEDKFDTTCDNETRAGSKFRRRYCKAVFERDAIETEAKAVALNYLKSTIPKGTDGSDGPGDGSPRTVNVVPADVVEPAMMDIQALRKAYRENMIAVVSRDPQLIDMVRRRAEMEKKYDELRRQAFGLKPKAPEDKPAP